MEPVVWSYTTWFQDYPEDQDLLGRKAAKAKKEAAAKQAASKPKSNKSEEVRIYVQRGVKWALQPYYSSPPSFLRVP